MVESCGWEAEISDAQSQKKHGGTQPPAQLEGAITWEKAYWKLVYTF